jgi:simple sugar transport system ATP-binding protein
VLIDPTAGVDVKSKEALLGMAERAREAGRAVIVASGELDDLRGCDRVLVMFRGRIVAQFQAGWLDHELIASIEGVDLNEA